MLYFYWWLTLSIKKLLDITKASIKNGTYDMVPTTKNRNSRRKYGLTLYDIEEMLLTLDINDLVKGPTTDRDYPNEELFIFKKQIKPNITFYIKLKEKNNQIKILSFHEDER